MSLQPGTEASVLERLNSLERQNRRLKRIGVAVALAIACGVFLAADKLWSSVLETEKLVLRDETGKIRGKIEATSQAGIVQVLLDDKGTERIRLSVDQQGYARVWVLDDEGEPRVSLRTYPSNDKEKPNQAGIALIGAGKDRDYSKKEGVWFATSKDGSVGQELTDQKGNSRANFRITPQGLSSLQFTQQQGDDSYVLIGTEPKFGAYFHVHGRDSKSAILAQAAPDGSAALSLRGKNDQTRLNHAIDAHGHASHSEFDDDGKKVEPKAIVETRIVTQEVAKPSPVYTPPSTYTPPSYTPPMRVEPVKPREEQCLTCSGSGRLTCTKCNGAKVVVCTTCDSRARVKCTTCDSEGMVSSGFFTKTKSRCTECGGTKMKACGDCNGTKRAKCGLFFGCNGTGTMSCYKCSGSGRVKLNNGSN